MEPMTSVSIIKTGNVSFSFVQPRFLRFNLVDRELEPQDFLFETINCNVKMLSDVKLRAQLAKRAEGS